MNVGSRPAEREIGAHHVDWAAAGEYVLDRRTAEGGYCFYRTPEWAVEEPNAPDTLAALESLRLLDTEMPAPAGTARWLRSLQDDGGGYPTLTIGWAALRALDVLAVTPARSPDAWVRGWFDVLATRDRPRDWRAAIIDAWHLMELVSLRPGAHPEQDCDSMVALLDAARAADGGWARPGTDLETTAIAVRAAALADPRRQPDPQLAAYLSRCEDEQLGLRLAPDARATSVGALWGGLTLGDVLRRRPRYPDAAGRQLTLLQRADGGLGARHRAISTLQATWRGLEAARLLDRLQQEGPP